MDLRGYYQKVRELEARLPEPCVVVSHSTADGGRAGVRSEVPRGTAARMIVDGMARAATEEEASEFQEKKRQAKQEADQLAAASRMQVTVVSQSDLRYLKGQGRGRE
jgi:hypothetical protein